MTKYFAALLIFLVAWPTLAADPNGYTAQYECRAGGPQCNVDIATYVSQSCQQTITTADSAATISSRINGGSQYICIQNGDYTGKGTITITSDGTSSNRKVLRYIRSGDTDDNPWEQSVGNKVIIGKLNVNANYWIIHRIESANNFRVVNAINVILSRVYVSNRSGETYVVFDAPGSDNTLQNSVLNNTPKGGGDHHCVFVSSYTSNIRIVNNEIFNCKGDSLQNSPSNGMSSLVIENNDLYITSAYHTTGGTKACAENGTDFKAGGKSTAPLQIIHNRFWGYRYTDTSCGGDGSFGEAIIFHETSGFGDHNSYGIIQNNIIFDGSICIASPNGEAGGPNNWSIIGNICYGMQGVPTGTTRAIGLMGVSNEIYLNTFIQLTQGNSVGWLSGGDGSSDVLCNVVIDGGSSSTTATKNNQVYYNSTKGGEINNIELSISTRSNSSSYSLAQIVRTTSANSCINGTESACFLYKVTKAGTSAGTAPSYCTTLGCVQTDGSVTLRAIRGPYTFYRKLRTGPETYTIPYTRVFVNASNSLESASEVNFCPFNYASRRGIGINDSVQ